MKAAMRDFFLVLNGFRKLTICLLLLIISTIVLVVKLIDGPTFASIMTVVIPSYFASNGMEHATDAIKDWLSTRKSEAVNKSMELLKGKE